MQTEDSRDRWLRELMRTLDNGDMVLRSLYEFYLVDRHIHALLPIITSHSRISIRVLDWFVTNYAKKHNVVYVVENERFNSISYFNVHLQYKSQLKGYKKKLFDPFCRKKRIFFYYEPTKCFVTTVGQLNFFRWAIKNKVLEYVEGHLDAITADMNESNRPDPESESTSEEKPNRVLMHHQTSVSLDFD